MFKSDMLKQKRTKHDWLLMPATFARVFSRQKKGLKDQKQKKRASPNMQPAEEAMAKL